MQQLVCNTEHLSEEGGHTWNSLNRNSILSCSDVTFALYRNISFEYADWWWCKCEDCLGLEDTRDFVMIQRKKRVSMGIFVAGNCVVTKRIYSIKVVLQSTTFLSSNWRQILDMTGYCILGPCFSMKGVGLTLGIKQMNKLDDASQQVSLRSTKYFRYYLKFDHFVQEK